MSEYALRLENSADTAERVRNGDALTLTPGVVSGARNGLRADGGGVVSAVEGSMTVEVTPFSAWVDGGASDAQGGYPFVLPAVKTLTVTDGDAVLSRTDTVVAEVRHDTYDASGFTDARVRIVPGTPGAGAPALPATCVALRDLTIPAGTSAGTGGLSSSNMGTDRRVYTAALGGVVPVSGVTERDAMGAQLGQPVFRLDTGRLQVFDGSEWSTFKQDDGLLVQRGTVDIDVTGGGTTQSVTFPVPFSGPPTAVVSSGNSNYFGVTANPPTSSAFDARIVHRDGTNTTATVKAHWIAVGPA